MSFAFVPSDAVRTRARPASTIPSSTPTGTSSSSSRS